jgi:hypothetical protein
MAKSKGTMAKRERAAAKAAKRAAKAEKKASKQPTDEAGSDDAKGAERGKE